MSIQAGHEEWRPIPGLDGYSVSNLGNVMGPRGKLLKLSFKDKHKKYYKFSFYDKIAEKNTTMDVHKAVAFAFLGAPPDGMVVCHGAKGTLNNEVCNLSYGTQSKNAGKDRWRDGTIAYGTKHHFNKLSEKEVLFIYKDKRSDVKLAQLFGVSSATIWAIRHGRIWRWLTQSSPQASPHAPGLTSKTSHRKDSSAMSSPLG